MPCYDPDSRSLETHELTERIDKLTRMLCALCGLTPDATIQKVDSLASWWKRHQKQDAKRN